MKKKTIQSSAIAKVQKIKGIYNTRITFTDGQSAEYNLTDKQRTRLKAPHPGSYYNKNIRIKETPF